MLIPQSAHFLWLILASVSYFVISEYNGYKLSTSAISLRYIAPIVLFYTGFIRGKTSYSTVKNDMLIMGFASCVHGAVNLFQNRSVDILSLHGRYYVDVYSGVVSAIVQNLMFVFTTPLLFYFFIIEKNKKVKMLGIFCGLIGLYGTFANASRTLLLITGIVSLLSYFMYLLSSKRVDISVFRFVASVCLIIIIGIIIVCINPSFIENWFLNTALGQRGASRSLTEDLRWKYAGDIIKMLP